MHVLFRSISGVVRQNVNGLADHDEADEWGQWSQGQPLRKASAMMTPTILHGLRRLLRAQNVS